MNGVGWAEPALAEKDKPKTMDVIPQQYRSTLRELDQLTYRERSLLISRMMAIPLEYLIVLSRCDETSPIERWMAIGLWDWIRSQPNSKQFELIPQFELDVGDKQFRLDFLLRKREEGFVAQIGIECDGKHHKNRFWLMRDQEREEAIRNQYGICIVRFTGKEINQDVKKCVMSAVRALHIVETTCRFGVRKDDEHGRFSIV